MSRFVEFTCIQLTLDKLRNTNIASSNQSVDISYVTGALVINKAITITITNSLLRQLSCSV